MDHFKVLHKEKDSHARCALLHTRAGDVHTPVFMPVATQATVKAVSQDDLAALQTECMLSNTYHLYLRPGLEVLRKAGGLHKFMSHAGPILTDSGGFQVYSLSRLRKISEEGVKFSSHIDGSPHLFTPEKVIDWQAAIGSDIWTCLDVCVENPADYGHARKALDQTKRWAERARRHFDKVVKDIPRENRPLLFGILQGSTYPDLRAEAARHAAELDFDGFALGGLSVGETKKQMREALAAVMEPLPKNKPVYFMGLGSPEDIWDSVGAGVDMFDCVLPTRNARHGMLYTAEGIINIKNSKWKEDFDPIDAGSPVHTSRTHSRAYLRHLFINEEILGMQLASLQNLGFYLWLVGEARRRIFNGDFLEWKNQMVKKVSARL